MKILSIEYPKTKVEFDKIDQLVSNYEKLLKPTVELEMKEHVIVSDAINQKT